MSRSGVGGPPASLTTGMAFGVPPIIKFGSRELQERFLPELLMGKKRTCIAITEPEAGSDVANIHTTAEKTPDGKHYVVNGTKKWSDMLPSSSTLRLLTVSGLRTVSGPPTLRWLFVPLDLDLQGCRS